METTHGRHFQAQGQHEKYFLKRLSWCSFFGALVLGLSINCVPLFYIHQVNTQSLILFFLKVSDLTSLLTTSPAALATVSIEDITLLTNSATLYETLTIDAYTSWKICLTCGLLHVGFTIVILGLVFL
eukprot:Awhi_evm1s10253